MLKALIVYAVVIGGIAACAGMSGASHITQQAIERMERTQ